MILLVFNSSINMNGIILPVTLSAFCFATKIIPNKVAEIHSWMICVWTNWLSEWLTNKESLVLLLKWFVPEWITVFKSIERIIKWLTCFVPERISVLEQIVWMNDLLTYRQSRFKTYTGIIMKHAERIAGKSPIDSLKLQYNTKLTLLLLEIRTNNCITVNNTHTPPSIYCENWV